MLCNGCAVLCNGFAVLSCALLYTVMFDVRMMYRITLQDTIAEVTKVAPSGRPSKIGQGPASLLASLMLRHNNHHHAAK